MKTKWLIQTSNIMTYNLEALYNGLSSLNIDFSDFGLIPFSKTITNIENVLSDSEIYITRGGTKFLTLLNKVNSIEELVDEKFLDLVDISRSEEYLFKLRNSIDYNISNFDLLEYSKLNLPLLNYDSEYILFEEAKDLTFESKKFIKPSKDLKSFNGGILNPGTSIKEFILNQMHQETYKEEFIVIANLKNIFAEYRFFIIEGKVITQSMYKMGDRVVYNSFVPEYIKEYAKKYAKLYLPANIYVMDLAETKDGVFIVEYNCWNASGLYHCDVKELIHSVDNFKKGNF